VNVSQESFHQQAAQEDGEGAATQGGSTSAGEAVAEVGNVVNAPVSRGQGLLDAYA